MSKIGDVVFCVDCDLARSARPKVAVGDSSPTLDDFPRRMATKKDATGDALCAACLDARVQRRRSEFLQPHAATAHFTNARVSASEPLTSASLDPRPVSSSLGRPTAALRDASAKPPETPVRRLSAVRIDRVRPTVKRTTRKAPKKTSKRKVARTKPAKIKRGGRVGASVDGLKGAEAQVLEWILEHGMHAVEDLVSRVSERIRKLL